MTAKSVGETPRCASPGPLSAMVNALTLQSTQVYDGRYPPPKGANGCVGLKYGKTGHEGSTMSQRAVGPRCSCRRRLAEAYKLAIDQAVTCPGLAVRRCTTCRKSQCCVICNDLQRVTADKQEAYLEVDEVNTYSQYSQVTRPKHAAYPSQSIVTALCR